MRLKILFLIFALVQALSQISLAKVPEHFLTDRATAQEIFDTVLDGWESTFTEIEAKKLWKLAHKSKRTGESPAGQEEIDFILAIRKQAQVMRTAFYLLDKDHEVPKKFNAFVVALGNYKDSVVAAQKYQAGFLDVPYQGLQAYIRESAQGLMEQMEQEAWFRLHKKFKASGKSEQKDFIKNRLKLLSKILYPENPIIENKAQMVIAEDYHTVRKIYRDFYWYFSFLKEARGTNQLDHLIQTLDKAQSKMGRRNDQLTQSLLGEKEMLQSEYQEISKGVLKAAEVLLLEMGKRPLRLSCQRVHFQ